MQVVRLQTAGVVAREYQGKEVRTGFFKTPVEGPVFLTRLGFRGDQQADLKNHGGPDKAVLVYALEHYPYWENVLGRDPGPAFMGENLTVQGLTEEIACIGDTYRLGEALVQVSQPRVPCFKVNIGPERSDILKLAMETLFTGFYLRVLEEGRVAAGDRVTRVQRPSGAPTVAWANQIRHREKENRDAVRRLLEAEGLAEAWREPLRRMLV